MIGVNRGEQDRQASSASSRGKPAGELGFSVGEYAFCFVCCHPPNQGVGMKTTLFKSHKIQVSVEFQMVYPPHLWFYPLVFHDLGNFAPQGRKIWGFLEEIEGN